MDELRTEYSECVTLVDFLERMKIRGYVINFTHVPNETYTPSQNQKRKNRALGVKPGFPDYIILTPKEMIVLEMKRPRGGKVSKEQKEWLLQLWRLGIQAVVCNGYDEAEAYLKSRFQM